MDTTEQEIRALKKKARSWLASLIYYSARREVNVDTFNRRLRSIFEPVLKTDILKEAIKDALPETIQIKEAMGIKKRMMSSLTPDKVHKRMLSYPRIPSKKMPIKDKADSFTLGKLIIGWALLTDQFPPDFMGRVSLNVTRLYLEWRDTTGCLGLSDEECYAHPKESARVWSGIYRALIRETPVENLVYFMQTGIEALSAIAGMPGLEQEIHKLLCQVSPLVVGDAAQKIELALEETPNARKMIDIPEIKALVLREEARLSWSKNTENEALKILRGSLNPQLKEAVINNEEAIRSSMEAVGRRGLLNNLEAALKGQLRPRFIDSIGHFLQGLSRKVTSEWEFETSPITKEQIGSIRQWLFRR